MANKFENFTAKIKRSAQFMAGPKPIYWLMPWFMILLVAATIDQKNIGLYDAVHKYLYDFIFWIGPIPLLGGGTTLVLITISLALKFLFFSPWSWKRCGIILSHLGCLMLLLGGLVTIIDSEEGFIIIPEGEERNYYQDYHNRNLVISNNENSTVVFNFDDIKAEDVLKNPDFPFNINIIDKCNNCDVIPSDNKDRQGLAKEIMLKHKASELNREENFSGLTFSLIEKDSQAIIGEFIILEDVKQDKFHQNYNFEIIRKKTNLPFSIALEDFRKIDYPGTNKASNYQSDLTLRENNVRWPVMIEMNQPYRYKGYSIFQSSFDQRDGTEVSVLNIVKNSGRLFPYISSFIIFLGLFLHLISRTVRRNQSIKKAKKMFRFFVLILLVCILPLQAYAQEKKIDFDRWSNLSILYDGRIMPLDSFSNIIFEKISDGNIHDTNAFLANVIFEPENAIFHKVFVIKDAERFGLEPKKLYDFTNVSKVINDNQETLDKLSAIPEKNLSIEQKNLLELQHNFVLYNQLLRSMTALIPLNINGKENPQTYLELAIKNDDTVPPTPKAEILKISASNNIIFKIIPIDSKDSNFITPWEALRNNEIMQENLSSLLQWQSAVIAYREKDIERWDKAVEGLISKSSMAVSSLEKKYNNWSLAQASFILFCLSLFLLILSEFIKKSFVTQLSFATLGLASIAITTDVILRIIITQRPPVGTLYESILFVTVITGLTAFLYSMRHINKTSLFIGSISGIILLLIANAFVGIDSFSPLVAVLNTDFWLATHVIIITAGYGFCILVSLYAHIIMWNQNYNKKNPPYKNMNVLVILSLLFVTVGTILGGLWADQSWGRFWGWDPKENGAMLIALWIIWLLHGKITKDMTTKYYMAGMAFLSVIVALAWFGVNLLSVGLHSYGFISGIALGLGSFCALETAIIIYLLYFHSSLSKRTIS